MSDDLSGPAQVGLLDTSQIPGVGELLARAFQEDPVNRYVQPEFAHRLRGFAEVYAGFLRYASLAGRVWTTAGPPRGAAIWLPPEHGAMRTDLMVQAGLHLLPSMLGEEAADRLVQFIRHLESVHQRQMPGPHWYLMLLGVDPAGQRRGLGGRLLKPALDRADAEGSMCYLETAQPDNIPFYRKHGFEIVIEEIEPVSGLKFWAFQRVPARRARTVFP